MPTSDSVIGDRFALQGRVVTMDAANTVHERGTVFIDAGRIGAVVPAPAPPPPPYANVPVIKTGGTIYPGLIELHNHLSYDVLPLWQVPKKYTNRDQWGGIPAYRKLISGPMTVLGKTPGYPEAVVRYVECKCLLGGVTTSQGIALFSNAGIIHYYRGIVRNVEEPDDTDLPSAADKISDVQASDANKFMAHLKSSSCLLLHLSEGTDQKAREHFLALHVSPAQWAITKALGGIHCVALQATDFQTLQANGGAMIWSPLSNLLLYGQTANVTAAKAAGILMGLGSDWSPSGSKNLLGELKVARLVSASLGGLFTDPELLAMATRNAAQILKWDKAIGSIEVGKHADLLVVNGQQDDAYARLFEARETDIALVLIAGVPRYGRSGIMKRFGVGTETWRVGNANRTLNLKQESADPVVGAIKLSEARDRLRDGMQRLAELAHNLEHPPAMTLSLDRAQPQWSLVLDHDEPSGIALRPHLPYGARHTLTAEMPVRTLAAVPLSDILGPIPLDPLTVADDPNFLDGLRNQSNLPAFIKQKLPALY